MRDAFKSLTSLQTDPTCLNFEANYAACETQQVDDSTLELK